MKLTLVAAIKNGLYQSWTGLTAADAAKHFPESMETWKGHDQKIKTNLRSTKLALEEVDSYYHVDPPVSGDRSGDNDKAKKGPK